MMAVVVFAYTLSLCEGLKEYKKMPVKKYKSGLVSKEYSVFTIGLDKLSALSYKTEAFLAYFVENIITKLSPYKSKHFITVQ